MREEAWQRNAKKAIRELGPEITALLSDVLITDIMLNADGSIWIDRMGEGMSKSSLTLSRDRALLFIGSVAALKSTTVTEKSAILQATLPGGQRFEAMIEPVTPAPVFTIRCSRAASLKLSDYVPDRMTEKMAQTLSNALIERKNIIISGGTGSGKTTLTSALLNKLSELCPDDRIALMEDTREIQLSSQNVVYEQSNDNVSMCELLAANLRMRPDRIILGETRGKEALDLLKSWNTGHPGGICTLHANSALSALARFESLILEAQNLGITYIRSLIADAVDILVYIEREKKTGPKVKDLIAVKGIDLDGRYITEPLASN